MQSYKGLQGQISDNNRKSILLLLGFPSVIIAGVWLVFFILNNGWDSYVQDAFLSVIPGVLLVVGVWFLIAFLFHSKMIQYATKSKPLERKENMRVYNLVENLCMSQGMKTPKIFIIETEALNAFASGMNEKNHAVTLTRGIIDKLEDHELEGVIAHELAHIRNNDVRLLIISIIFVGILSFVVQVAFRSLLWGGGNNRRKGKTDGRVMIVILLVSLLVYLITIIFRFALSRKREYMADAAAVEMTKRPDALASALRKISGQSIVDEIRSDDVKSMFIENNPKEKKSAFSGISGLFATHPPIEKRISFLEQI
tara:strand:- start:292 stop:1227 length:936 start_codon:yes stop_codon:yes gene_type:complete